MAVDALENMGKLFPDIDIEPIIDEEFRKSHRWKHILRQRDETEFRLSFIEINWDAKQALKKKNYAIVINMLEPYDGNCPAAVQKKLDTARALRQVEKNNKGIEGKINRNQ